MESTEKRHTLIVGGTRGAGRALVNILSKNKDNFTSIIGKNPPYEKDKNIPNTFYWIADILNQELIYKTLADVIHRNGKISHIVFFQRYKGKGDDWTGEIETSLTATKNIIEYLAEQFDNTSENSIVMVSSIVSHFIVNEQPLSYHIGKAGINQMVRYYAVKLGPKGIRVNSVVPASILKEESIDFYLKNERLHELCKKIIPLGRVLISEDVANVIDFLCSSKSSFITGQNIIIDGGISLQGHESLAFKLMSLDNPEIKNKSIDKNS